MAVASAKITLKGMKELEAAIARNPRSVEMLAKRFLTRGMAELNRVLIRNPWRVGQSGGGIPVDTGNLRDSHIREIKGLSAIIRPSEYAPYAKYVHKKRPWFDYAAEKTEPAIKKLTDELLEDITQDLAK
jgi:hypothetical protein